ncbi:hypothetical protein H6775_03690 [Candidatus Nomurabacteria bacterium]|nr:hypothetical protein [Candidatus Nomurabacteria bacterium]
MKYLELFIIISSVSIYLGLSARNFFKRSNDLMAQSFLLSTGKHERLELMKESKALANKAYSFAYAFVVSLIILFTLGVAP